MKPADNSVRTVSIAGTGIYLPEKVMTNRDLEKIVDTSDEWIFTRTGMHERRIAREDEYTSHLAAAAGRAALADAGIGPGDVDLLIVATLSPDAFFPSTACYTQALLGASNAWCFDLGAACSGALFALETARSQIAAGTVETALVIGAEKMSTFLNWKDRNTCVLFGDGAGAFVLRPAGARRGIMDGMFGSDGTLAHMLGTPGGGTRHPMTHGMLDQGLQYLRMDGREVYKHAVTGMTKAVTDVLEKHRLDPADIACFIAHQANARIIEAIGKRLHVEDRMFMNVEKYANTSAAALPIAVHEAVQAGKVKDGDLMLLVTFGGGFTWGATIVEWTKAA